jgi:hypothetical protein
MGYREDGFEGLAPSGRPRGHFALPLGLRPAPFSRTTVPMSPAIRLDPRGEGVLMVGLDSDALAAAARFRAMRGTDLTFAGSQIWSVNKSGQAALD